MEDLSHAKPSIIEMCHPGGNYIMRALTEWK